MGRGGFCFGVREEKKLGWFYPYTFFFFFLLLLMSDLIRYFTACDFTDWLVGLVAPPSRCW